MQDSFLVTYSVQAGGGLQPAGLLPGAAVGAHQAAQEGDTETGGHGEALPLLHSKGEESLWFYLEIKGPSTSN